MDKRDPLIVSAVRTAIGSFGGSLVSFNQKDLASIVMAEVCRRVEFPKETIDDVYWGTVMVRSDENGVARCAALKAGIPVEASAVQLNRACCSSMEALRMASMAIRLGESDAVIAGGGGHPYHFPVILGYPKPIYYSLPGRKPPGVTFDGGSIMDDLIDNVFRTVFWIYILNGFMRADDGRLCRKIFYRIKVRMKTSTYRDRPPVYSSHLSQFESESGYSI